MEIKDTQGNQEVQDGTRVLDSQSIRVGDESQAIFQREEVISSTQLSSRTVRFNVPFPKFLPGGDGSRDELGRENYINAFNSAKYLLAKYGDRPAVKKYVSLLQLPADILSRDQDGRLQLPDSAPEGYLEKPFTADDLRKLESLVIESNSLLASKGKCIDMEDAHGRIVPYVPRPVLVDGRENYINYHMGMNYLVQKYGSRPVNEVLTPLMVSRRFNCPRYPRLELAPTRNENGQEQLEPIPQGDTPMLADNFDNDMLQKLESLIIEHSKFPDNPTWKNIQHVFDVFLSASQTARAAISLSEAVATVDPDIIDRAAKACSLANSAIGNCKLGIEIASKDKRCVLQAAKVAKTAAQTEQRAISLFKAVCTGSGNSVVYTATKAFLLVNSVIDGYLLYLDTSGKAEADKTISPPAILREEEKLVYYADEENIARGHFEDFYNAAKYLIKKYGITSMPVDFLNELKALCGGEIPLVPDDQGQLQLANSVPNGHREEPFTMKNLAKLENRITGQEGREKAKVVLRIAGAAISIGTAAATLGAGITIPGAVSLAKAAYGGVQLAIDLFKD
ncbi:MAG: hypothetical protein LBB17_01730 [Puniceicoccales bacterium]|jgi:hypothetical protein|nr:hypothetical protein [Puniceicoccales bacterium]